MGKIQGSYTAPSLIHFKITTTQSQSTSKYQKTVCNFPELSIHLVRHELTTISIETCCCWSVRLIDKVQQSYNAPFPFFVLFLTATATAARRPCGGLAQHNVFCVNIGAITPILRQCFVCLVCANNVFVRLNQPTKFCIGLHQIK